MGLLMLTLLTITREARVAQHAAADRWLGFGALFRLRCVPVLKVLSLVFFFSYGPSEAALPLYGGQTLHVNAAGYGLLWTGFGLGAFTGVLTLTKLSHRWRQAYLTSDRGALGSAALPPVFHWTASPRDAVPRHGRGILGYTPMETTLLQRLVPAEIRGQVFGGGIRWS